MEGSTGKPISLLFAAGSRIVEGIYGFLASAADEQLESTGIGRLIAATTDVGSTRLPWAPMAGISPPTCHPRTFIMG